MHFASQCKICGISMQFGEDLPCIGSDRWVLAPELFWVSDAVSIVIPHTEELNLSGV